MWVLLNGKFVAEENAVVSVFDRSFRYGDGVFETLLVRKGKFFRWDQHLERLQRSAAFLRIPLPCSAVELLAEATELVARNKITEGTLRLQVSRGVGPRGYAPPESAEPLVVMTAQPLNPAENRPWGLITSSRRIAATDPLVGHKTCNRLIHVLAAMEACDRGADEALLLNTESHVAEGSTSNVFWIQDGVVCTPPLAAGALPGITRAAVLEICHALSLPSQERCITCDKLLEADAVFLTFTSRGIVEAESLDGTLLRRAPRVQQLRVGLQELIAAECPL